MKSVNERVLHSFKRPVLLSNSVQDCGLFSRIQSLLPGVPKIPIETDYVKGLRESQMLVNGYFKNYHNLGDFGLFVLSVDSKDAETLDTLLTLSKSFQSRLVIVLDHYGVAISSWHSRQIKSKMVVIHSMRTMTLICPGKGRATTFRFKDIIHRVVDWLNSCPISIHDRKPTITTVGKNPFLLSVMKTGPDGKSQKIQLYDDDGNPIGVDNDLSDLICERFKTNGYMLVPTDTFDHFDEVHGKWMGRVGVILKEEADFAVGYPTIMASANEVVDYTNWIHVNEVGFSTGHPRILTSFFNIIRPFK